LIEGRAVSLPENDIDTDRIIPARFMKGLSFEGLGAYAFYDERFDAEGRPKEHPLNDPSRAGASILVAGRNFGCGSSREHAPQALLRAGFRAIVAESFAEIFAGNCASIGLVVARLEPVALAEAHARAAKKPEELFAVDLEAMELRIGPRGTETRYPLAMRDSDRALLLSGEWDSAGALLEAREAVLATWASLPYASWS
jgi:3-isopropylmalate/(R)-2-methylmalate dehydratase small subunit